MKRIFRSSYRAATAGLTLTFLLTLAPLAEAQSKLDDLRPERRYDAEVVAAIEKAHASRADAFRKLAASRTAPDTSVGAYALYAPQRLFGTTI